MTPKLQQPSTFDRYNQLFYLTTPMYPPFPLCYNIFIKMDLNFLF